MLISDVERILQTYPIPESYKELIRKDFPLDLQCIQYSAHHDIVNSSFDPMKCLQDKIIFAGWQQVPPLDNMSKAWKLLPGNKGAIHSTPSERKRPLNRSDSELIPLSKNTLSLEKRIAFASCREKHRKESPDNEDSLTMSPFSLLLRIMQNKEKATILLRRRNRFYIINTCMFCSQINIIFIT